MHRAGRPGNVPKKRDHRAEKELDDRDGVSGRSIDDGDSERSRGIESDVVDTNSGTANDFQPARSFQQVRRYARRTAAYDRIVVDYPVKELLLGQRRYFVDDELRLGRKDCDTFGIDFIGDENAIGHYSERIGEGGTVVQYRLARLTPTSEERATIGQPSFSRWLRLLR